MSYFIFVKIIFIHGLEKPFYKDDDNGGQLILKAFWINLATVVRYLGCSWSLPLFAYRQQRIRFLMLRTSLQRLLQVDVIN